MNAVVLNDQEFMASFFNAIAELETIVITDVANQPLEHADKETLQHVYNNLRTQQRQVDVFLNNYKNYKRIHDLLDNKQKATVEAHFKIMRRAYKTLTTLINR